MGGVRSLTGKMAKFEKTKVYICSGTARPRPMASALHDVFLDRVDFFARGRDPKENGA